MNETIGKRVQELRKRRSLTQKQLADLIGVTPQAVSKWETDESCPDISILPALAAELGVSTDYLLGATHDNTPAKEAEIVDVNDADDAASEKEGGASFHYEFRDGKVAGVFLGLFLLCAGVLLYLTQRVDWFVKNDISYWNMIWPSFLIFLGMGGLFSRNSFPFSLGLFALGVICLLNNLSVIIIGDIWLLIVVGILVIAGISAIFGVFKKKPKHVHHKKGQVKFNYNDDSGVIRYDASFGSNHIKAKATTFQGGTINTSFGEYSLDLQDLSEFASDARLKLSVSFGEFTLYLPRNVRMELSKSGSFSGYSIKGNPDANAPYVLTLEGAVSFGNLCVQY